MLTELFTSFRDIRLLEKSPVTVKEV